MYLLPYKNGSRSARDLAEALDIKQIKREGSKFSGSKDKLVINWGSTTMSEEVAKCEVLNKPEAVLLASNKLNFFKAVGIWNRQQSKRVNLITIPSWTEVKDVAYDYIGEGVTIVARTILNGHSGAGIVLCETREQLDAVDAPLYVVYTPKKQEYRVHVLRGEVVDIQRKARRTDIPDDQVNWKIRNHDNGFIYSRNEVAANIPQQALTDSINSVSACGLDFGAVDVIYNEHAGRTYVLEVNTAPGLSGETLAGYTRRMKEIMDGFTGGKNIKKEVNHFIDEIAAPPLGAIDWTRAWEGPAQVRARDVINPFDQLLERGRIVEAARRG